MHRARLTIDLPSEDLPADPALLAVLKWIFTTEDVRRSHERVVGTGLSWCQRLLAAAAEAGLDEVIAVVADGTELYLDQGRRHEDFAQVLSAVVEHGGLRDGFAQLQVVVSGERGGWHAVAVVDMKTEVEKGQPEISIDWSARSLQLRVTKDETPSQYAARIRSWTVDAAATSEHLAVADAMLDALNLACVSRLSPAATAVVSRGHRVVVPGPTQVGRFRTLGFGRTLRARSYRPRASETRVGAYDEPHVYYFFDPYHDLLSWIVARQIEVQQWAGPAMALVDRQEATLDGRAQWEVPFDAVTFEDGTLNVDDTVPVVAGLDVAEAGNPNAPGFAGGVDDG